MRDHCIVCGMGSVGYRVVELLQRLGEKVVVVTDRVLEDRRRMAEAFGVEILIGDARNDQLLVKAGLGTAKALIAATNQDLVNIEVALDAQRIQPGLPVVIRLFDQELARQLEATLNIRRALGMSALAAPSFTAAALGESVLASLKLSECPWVVGRQRIGDGLVGRCVTVGDVARRHRLVCLARESPDGACAALPPPDTPLRPGDRLSFFGRKEDWDALFSPPAPRAANPSVLQRLQETVQRTAALWREGPLVLRILFLSLCALLPMLVILFRFLFGHTLADAIFYTVITLHGEIGLTDAGPGVKMYEILLMVLGSVTLATIYSIITDVLVTSRLGKLFGRNRPPRSGHVVVVGVGDIGFRVIDELASLDVPVLAVDADPDSSFLATVRANAPLVVGDARLEETLRQAGLPGAQAVVAVTSDDSVNLGVGIAARRMSPGIRTVVRLFDADFARKVETAFGVDAALSSARIAAPTFTAAGLFENVVKAFIIRDRIFILALRPAGAEWAGHKPSDLHDGIAVLVRNGDLAMSDEPLAAEEEILTVTWRAIAPAWTEQSI
jgi:Trk K+ transport system NAD-binding subunit